MISDSILSNDNYDDESNPTIQTFTLPQNQKQNHNVNIKRKIKITDDTFTNYKEEVDPIKKIVTLIMQDYSKNVKVPNKIKEKTIFEKLQKVKKGEFEKIENINISNINFINNPSNDNNTLDENNRNNEGTKQSWWKGGIQMLNRQLSNNNILNDNYFTNNTNNKNFSKMCSKDLKYILTKEQINNNFDHFLFESLIKWESNKTVSVNTPENIHSSKIFTSLVKNKQIQNQENNNKGILNFLKQTTQTTISIPKKYFWNSNQIKISDKDIEILKNKMNLIIPFYNILQIQKQTKKKEINFSVHELEILFTKHKIKLLNYLFKKNESLISQSQVEDNIFFVESQLYGIEDQIGKQIKVIQIKNKHKLNNYWTESEKHLQNASQTLYKIQTSKSYLNNAQKVINLIILDQIETF